MLTDEQTFAILLYMDDALALLDLAISGVAMFPAAGLLDDDLRSGVVAVQRHIDRLKVLHAGMVHEADRRRVWQASGSRDMADWLALGWLPLASLAGTHHGDWSVHCVWICDCDPVALTKGEQ